MPRHDDRHSSTCLYVGHLSSQTRPRDLEDLFARYGRVRAVDMKRDYAFVDFGDPRDADDARHSMDGRDFKGTRIVVEFSRTPRGPRGSHDYLERPPPPGSGRCFNCGIEGHWARDCKSGDWKNKCYRCCERGHIERNCQNSPKKPSRERRYSRPLSPCHGQSRSRGNSRSPSTVKREWSHDDVERRPKSPDDSRRPHMRGRIPSPRGRRDSNVPDDKNPRGIADQSPDDRKWVNGSDYGNSPKGSRNSHAPDDRSPRCRADQSPDDRKWDNEPHYGNSHKSRSPVDDAEAAGEDNCRSPVEENGHDRSPRPIPSDDEGNGGDEDNGRGDDNGGSPRGSP